MQYTDEFSFVLRPSTIPNAGIGVFAVHDIDQGTKLELMPDGYRGDERNIDEVPEVMRNYCIQKTEQTLICPENFRQMWMIWYVNHSGTPNAILGEGACYYAARNIAAGEEVFIDYRKFARAESEAEVQEQPDDPTEHIAAGEEPKPDKPLVPKKKLLWD